MSYLIRAVSPSTGQVQKQISANPINSLEEAQLLSQKFAEQLIATETIATDWEAEPKLVDESEPGPVVFEPKS
jgi:hypothetical protein